MNSANPAARPDIRSHDNLAVGADDSSELVLSLLSSSPDCVKLLSTDGKLDFMSYAGLCAMEIPDFDAISGRNWWDLWPDAEQDRLREAVAAAQEGESRRFTAFCPTAMGNPRWWDVSVTPVLGRDGNVSRVLSVSRDVTEMMARQKELELALETGDLLRREVDHRIKNSLGIVSSLLRMQARRAPEEAREALQQASARVQTIAQVHDRLHRFDGIREIDLGDYLPALCDDLGKSLQDGGLRTRHQIANLLVKPEVSVALGLVVAELVANAILHSGMTADSPLDVTLAVEGDRAVLQLADSGKGLPDDFAPEQSRGVGMQVIRSMIAQIDGEMDWFNRPEGGAAFRVRFAA